MLRLLHSCTAFPMPLASPSPAASPRGVIILNLGVYLQLHVAVLADAQAVSQRHGKARGEKKSLADENKQMLSLLENIAPLKG